MIILFEKKWSIFIDNSLVSDINNHNYVLLDQDTKEIISQSIQFNYDTKGAFDIRLLPLNQLWKKCIKSNILPLKKDIRKAIKEIKNSHININDNKIYIEKGGIDLGGIAKGYLIAKIVNDLKKFKIHSGTISLGGTVYSYGEDIIGVRNPFNPLNREINNQSVLKIKIKDEYVITSGTYEQEVIIDDNSYSHIINPRTGYPTKTNIKSVTLVGKDACKMDAYATAIFNMKLEEAIKLLKDHMIEGVFIFTNGNIFITDNLKGKIEMR